MRISQTTSMNLEWSKKYVPSPSLHLLTYNTVYDCGSRCLIENDWDFNKAVTAFTLLNVSSSMEPSLLLLYMHLSMKDRGSTVFVFPPPQGQGKIPREAFQ